MPDRLDLNLPPINSHAEYRAVWGKLGRIRISCVEKNEECRHEVGDSFVYETPYQRPEGVCPALLHVFELYLWRTILGFPSWNGENHQVYKLHCPDPKGTVWEMRKIDD